MSEQGHFEAIKRAREVLSNLPKREVSEKTERGYKQEYKRLLKAAKDGPPLAMLDLAKATTSASTWYRRKAAMLYFMQHQMTVLLKKQDQLQRAFTGPDDPNRKAWTGMVDALDYFAEMVPLVQATTKWPPQDQRKKRATKKRSLAGLPDNWRESLVKRLPKYRLAYLVAAATGCRPAELAAGVRLKFRNEDGVISIVANIEGAKVKADAGQPLRAIQIELDGIEGSLSTLLAAEIEAGATVAKIASEKRFSDAVTGAGQREWPKRKTTISPYSLRHQFAADRKAEDWSESEMASMMGHATDKTLTYYGDRKQRRSGGVKIKAVAAERQIKIKTDAGKRAKAKRTPGPK